MVGIEKIGKETGYSIQKMHLLIGAVVLFL